MIRLLVPAALLLLLAACGGSAAPGRPDLLGNWQLVSGEVDGDALPIPAGVPATLEVEEVRLGGSAFCNRYFAGYRLDGEALDLDSIGSTMMACAEPVMAAESRFLGALGAVDRASRDRDELVLTGDAVTLRFTRQVPVPDRELVGTRWVLDTLVTGDGPAGSASSVLGEPLLRLAADGTAAGSTGCRDWSGGWRRDGDVLTVEPLAAADLACPPEVTAQDGHVLAVLTAGPTAALAGGRLTLTAPDGRGLGYRAG